MDRRCVTFRMSVFTGIILTITALSPRTIGATTWHVPGDVPTIQAGISLAQPGDDVLVAAGVYPEHDIVMKGGIRVHSEQGPGFTTVDAQGVGPVFICSDFQEEAAIEGFTILHGHATGGEPSGGGVRCVDARLVVLDCIISLCVADAGGGGIFGSGSELVIENSRIEHCSAASGGGVLMVSSRMAIMECDVQDNQYGGGILAEGPALTVAGCVVSRNHATWGGTGGISVTSSDLTVRDCLITNNSSAEMGWASGLSIWSSAGRITTCTVAGNAGWAGTPSVFVIYSPNLAIEKTIVAFNADDGLFCSDSAVGTRCCDTYGNAGGNEVCGTDLGGNFSADPLFCDAANGDYTLDWESPCLPGNHPDGVDCGLIGALGAGCGTPPVTGACCFADDSCVVAEPQDCASQGGSYLGDDTDCEPNPCIPTAREKTTWGKIRADYR